MTELIKEFNEKETPPEQELNLFTIDVEKSYPSINPTLALEALKEMLTLDKSLDKDIKVIIETFITFTLKESYVTYKDRCYKSKVGIPTGGCNSRQIADIYLQWLLFKKIKPKIEEWGFIVFWKRFIDDGIGLWSGSKDEFYHFMSLLNKESQEFGIHFPISEVQFGKSVNFLDLTIYLDDENKMQHKLFIKPTDARAYLNPKSFHPKHVFTSIPFSQMIRVIKRNTKEETCLADLNELKIDLIKSGYEDNVLESVQIKAFERIASPKAKSSMENNTIIFTVDYFEDLKMLKDLMLNVERDVKAVFGNIDIKVATRKNSSIGNSVVKNKSLCTKENINLENQKCGDKRCMICPFMINTDSVIINDRNYQFPKI